MDKELQFEIIDPLDDDTSKFSKNLDVMDKINENLDEMIFDYTDRTKLIQNIVELKNICSVVHIYQMNMKFNLTFLNENGTEDYTVIYRAFHDKTEWTRLTQMYNTFADNFNKKHTQFIDLVLKLIDKFTDFLNNDIDKQHLEIQRIHSIIDKYYEANHIVAKHVAPFYECEIAECNNTIRKNELGKTKLLKFKQKMTCKYNCILDH